ncbi:MAG: hypothetical protein J7K82_03510 [Thermoproteales archaeon]|nr:hypothetical protein [Thermoproteales archaeon]
MPKGLREDVRKIALSVKYVKEVCYVRARSIGDKIYIDLVLKVYPSKDLYEAHRISEIIEKRRLLSKNVDVVVHIEPETSS